MTNPAKKTPFAPHPRSCPRQPLLWAALSFAIGIFAGFHFWRPPTWWLVAGLFFAASGLWFLRRRTLAAHALGLCALIVSGALSLQLRNSGELVDADILRFADGREIPVTAHVVREGRVQDRGSGGLRQVLDVETETVATAAGSADAHSGLRVAFYEKQSEDASTPPMRIFNYGERLRFTAKLSPPRNFRNPGAFDYRGYLQEKGIVALGSGKAETVELLPGFAGSRAELWRTRIHRSIIERVHALWPPSEAALVDAMEKMPFSAAMSALNFSALAPTTCWWSPE